MPLGQGRGCERRSTPPPVLVGELPFNDHEGLGEDTNSSKEATVTLIWFFVWLVSNVLGDNAPLTFDPVNWWAGLLLFAIAVDLAGQHAASTGDASESDRSHRVTPEPFLLPVPNSRCQGSGKNT